MHVSKKISWKLRLTGPITEELLQPEHTGGELAPASQFDFRQMLQPAPPTAKQSLGPALLGLACEKSEV